MATRKGSGTNDVLVGGATADVLLGLAGNDRLTGGSGNDRLDGGAGNDILSGGIGDDILSGGAGNDVLVGGAGNDKLSGGLGRDSLRGDAGNDSYTIDGAGEINKSLADSGIDTVLASVSYTLGTHQEHLRLTGSSNLSGTGNSGANALLGNNGANRLDGGAGADTLSGGGGDDVLVYDAADLAQSGGSGTDTVLFSGTGWALGTADFTHSTSIEVIDIRGTGANAVVLDATLVTGMSETDTLRIRAGVDDHIIATGAWVAGTDTVIGGVTYAQYSLAAATLQIESTAARLVGGVVSLANLDGSNGFRLNGVVADQQTGRSLSAAGDVNGDGYGDLLIGAFGTGPFGSGTGSTYVVFGQAAGFAASLDLSALDGSNGLRLTGVAEDQNFGRAVSSVSAAGDINGDGLGDLLIGALGADPNGDSSGASYVVFGRTGGLAATINLTSLDGNDGFRLEGVAALDRSGRSVSGIGDLNGDGFDDLIVGAPGADTNGSDAGASYVVFGRANGFVPTLNLNTLDGNNGFRLVGVATNDYSGVAVSGAGDINRDGFDDLIIGASRADQNGESAGVSYVVFGHASGFAASINLGTLDGSNGFRLDGGATYDFSGFAVSGGSDVNGDGFDDIIIGAGGADVNGSDSGASYVVFGHAGNFAATISLSALDGSNGFVLAGGGAGDYSGIAVSAAGDVNGDGYDDLLIGAQRADTGGYNFGASYLLFGQAGGFAASINLSTLDGRLGLRLDGVAAYDQSGAAVSAAGDVNGDGFDDLFIGSVGADPHGSNSGASYVVFGRDFTGSVELQGGTGNDVLTGTGANEVLIGGRGDDTLNGSGGSDALRGAHGNDILVWDAADRHIDGGSGTDTLRFSAGGLSLTNASLARTNAVEVLELDGSGANTIIVDGALVAHLSDNHALRIRAGTDDHITVTGHWVVDAEIEIGGVNYAQYTLGAATLQIEASAPHLIGGVLSLASLDGDNGFRLDGVAVNDYSGRAVSTVGDFNGDGFDDLLIGAF